MMKYSRAILITYTATALCATSLVMQARPSFAEQQQPKAQYGQIHFLNGKGEEKCALAVPETKGTYSFASSTEYCENNMAAAFWLENIPSATRIQLYENETCTSEQNKSNFYFQLKTVKQPTDWSQTPNPPATMTIDALRNMGAGHLIPNKNVRVDGAWVGSDYATEDLNERISCVYIERSQPVN